MLRWPCAPFPLLFLCNLRGPGHLEPSLKALADRAVALVDFKRAVSLGALALRNFKAITQLHVGDAKQFFFPFDAAFNVGFEVILRRDSARFQRAGQRARQSTAKRREQMINCRGQNLLWLQLVKRGVTAVEAEAQRLRKPFDVRLAQRPLLLNNLDFRGVN